MSKRQKSRVRTARTPVIFRHFRGVLDDDLPIEEVAAWVGQCPPEFDFGPNQSGKFLVKWIDVTAMQWLDRESLGRSIERVVTSSLMISPLQPPGFDVSLRRMTFQNRSPRFPRRGS